MAKIEGPFIIVILSSSFQHNGNLMTTKDSQTKVQFNQTSNNSSKTN